MFSRFHGAGAIRGLWVKEICCIENLTIILQACQKTCLSYKNITRVYQNLYRQSLCWKVVLFEEKIVDM